MSKYPNTLHLFWYQPLTASSSMDKRRRRSGFYICILQDLHLRDILKSVQSTPENPIATVIEHVFFPLCSDLKPIHEKKKLSSWKLWVSDGGATQSEGLISLIKYFVLFRWCFQPEGLFGCKISIGKKKRKFMRICYWKKLGLFFWGCWTYAILEFFSIQMEQMFLDG